jgi:hypothetical protein
MRKYKPHSNDEFGYFYDEWCARCHYEEEYRLTNDNGCPILTSSMAFDVDDPEYPEQLTYQDEKPCCTNFCTVEDKKPYRCPNTLDMFTKEIG